jgi:aminopeptidase N
LRKTELYSTLSKDIEIILKTTKSNANWLQMNGKSLTEWTTSSAIKPEQINYRLPTNLSPYFYDLTLKPYIGPEEAYKNKSFTFEGKQKIHFTCMDPTDRIVFHSIGSTLNAESLMLESKSDTTDLKVIKSIEYDLVRSFVIIKMSGECQKGSNYTLSFDYGGKILEALYGFYRSSYKDTNGNVK